MPTSFCAVTRSLMARISSYFSFRRSCSCLRFKSFSSRSRLNFSSAASAARKPYCLRGAGSTQAISNAHSLSSQNQTVRKHSRKSDMETANQGAENEIWRQQTKEQKIRYGDRKPRVLVRQVAHEVIMAGAWTARQCRANSSAKFSHTGRRACVPPATTLACYSNVHHTWGTHGLDGAQVRDLLQQRLLSGQTHRLRALTILQHPASWPEQRDDNNTATEAKIVARGHRQTSHGSKQPPCRYITMHNIFIDAPTVVCRYHNFHPPKQRTVTQTVSSSHTAFLLTRWHHPPQPPSCTWGAQQQQWARGQSAPAATATATAAERQLNL